MLQALCVLLFSLFLLDQPQIFAEYSNLCNCPVALYLQGFQSGYIFAEFDGQTMQCLSLYHDDAQCKVVFQCEVDTSQVLLYNDPEVIEVTDIVNKTQSPIFAGISQSDRATMLSCIGYHIAAFQKGEIVAFEEENIKHIGIVLSGAVDMIKEDLWGNKTMLVRMRKDELFGETFACGEDNVSVVTFHVSEDAEILFLPFDRVMHSCTTACVFHHRLIENMVRVIADKNRDLMRKVEVVSKRTIREKLLAYLSLQAQTQNSRYFEIPLGRVELAEYLCVDRSALTRELAKMKDEGLIDYDRNCFRLK